MKRCTYKINLSKMIFLAVTVCMCFIFSGCSTEPTYYSENQVEQYVKDVFGDDYKLIDIKSSADNTAEKNPEHEYVFTNSKGEYFSIYTSTSRSVFFGTEIKYYEKDIYDSYLSSMLTQHSEAIGNACENYGIDFKLHPKIDFDNSIGIYLDDYNQLKDAGELIAEIDEILSLEYDYSNAKIGVNFGNKLIVNVFVKPNAEGYNGNSEYHICGFKYLSNNKSNRLISDEVYKTIECEFVDYAKQNEGVFEIPQELRDKYPALIISVSSVNGNDIKEPFDYYFKRYGTTDTYYMGNLFPCTDYNVGDDHAFANLVECLGGEYKCEDSKAEWTIDNITWTAEYNGNEKTVDGFFVTRNGKELTLSKIGGDYSRVSSSGRGFTVGDLGKLLNADVIIDQKTLTAEIVKK